MGSLYTPIFAPALVEVTDEPGTLTVLVPVTGTLIALDQVPDPGFAGKQMGEGIAIEPSEGKVYAPFDGIVAHVIKKSKHAVILEHADGVQVLIHVGIDTVSLKGEGFVLHVETGEHVKAGQLLIEFDPDVIRGAGLSMVTPVIVPGGIDSVLEVFPASPGTVVAGRDKVIQVKSVLPLFNSLL